MYASIYICVHVCNAGHHVYMSFGTLASERCLFDLLFLYEWAMLTKHSLQNQVPLTPTDHGHILHFENHRYSFDLAVCSVCLSVCLSDDVVRLTYLFYSFTTPGAP